jgi:hypothetical protein
MTTPDTPDEPAPEVGARTPKTGASSLAKRYGPLLVVAVVIAAAVLVFAGGNDDSDDAEQGDDQPATELDRTELIRSGPMTTERAELEGLTDVDFGPTCDPETGAIRLPTIYAPPCVEPFTGDNGGATSQGVTGDSIKVVAYVSDPALDPLGAAMIGGQGANVDPDAATDTVQDYVDLYNQLFETYGRTVDMEYYTGTGASDDQDAARADAIAIAESEPFAVVGGPLQAREVFIEELTANGVVCPPGCAVAQNDSFIAERDPLVRTLGPTSSQAARLSAEVIGNLAGPGPAELAGDEATQAEERVYAVVHYDNPEGDQTEAYDTLVGGLEDQGIELAIDVPFFLDLARIQENARTIIAQLEEAEVTTVIFYGDPLMPQALTHEATAQDYHPEWILGPNVLADTALFARGFEQEQWSNGFGIAFAGTPGAQEIGDSLIIYHWAYDDQPPPSNIYAVLEPPMRTLFSAIHMAGPELAPETFWQGLRRLPTRGGGPTRPSVSYGNEDLWGEPDYGSSDDVTLIWWDPEAEGTDEIGQEGEGMYRFAHGGERYTLGEFPGSVDEAGLFDVGASAVELTELPAEDAPPDYPPPDL